MKLKHSLYLCLVSLIFVSARVVCAQPDNTAPKDIFTAIYLNNISAVQEMIKNDKDGVMSAKTANDISPLHYAAMRDRLEAAGALLKAGMDPDLLDGKKMTPLHWAASKGAVDTSRILLKYKANTKIKVPSNGWTALHFAAHSGLIESGKYLLDAGADINDTDNDGNTPIHIAYLFGNVNAVKFLLENGASVSLKNNDGNKPFALAKGETVKIGGTVPKSTVNNPSASTSQPQQPLLLVVNKDETSGKLVFQKAQTVSSSSPDDEDGYTKQYKEQQLNIPSGSNVPKLSLEDQVRIFLSDPNTIRLADGSAYRGSMRNSKFNGQGTLYTHSRYMYEGEWKDGKKSGVGIFTYPSGDKFNGSWKSDVPHGKGIFSYKNGGTISGTWNKGILQSGNGTYVTGDGSVFQGVWQNGRLVSQNRIK